MDCCAISLLLVQLGLPMFVQQPLNLWKVVCVTLVHNLESKVSSVQHVSPCWYDLAISVNDGLVKVKPIKVESHGADAH